MSKPLRLSEEIMKASDLFLRCLEAQGVDTIFGVPGEENADLMISLLNSSIEFVICRHEQSAAFMACMYGHLTGRPGVCLATLGPGATNLLTGVANANMDNAPLVAILGQASTRRLHKESHQNMDAISMYKPVSKWAATIPDADVIPEVITKAFKLAMANKPGATVIELPEDIAKEDTDAKPLPESIYQHEEAADPAEVKRALDLIASSNKPLVLLGGGGNRETCATQVQQFIEATGIYAAATFMGKGVLSAAHPKSLYCVGLGMKDIALKAFDAADLVICVGYDMVEWPPERWHGDHKQKIIHIDTLPAEVDRDYCPQVELVGDIQQVFTMLNAGVTDRHKKNVSAFSQIRQEITDELNEHAADTSFPVKPQRLLSDVRDILSEEDILISDVGAHKMWVARQYPTYKQRTCFISNGFCSMGGALPGAFMAKKLFPEKNVVAICGDGGFIMSIQALPTAVRYNIPFVAIVWDDNAYGLIKWKQEAAYDEYSHVDLDNPDLVAVAEAFGCHATQVNKTEDFRPALEAALARTDKPSVLIVPIDYSENMKLTRHLGEIVSH
jgi:acetolactate synthase I/II/III large subunit